MRSSKLPPQNILDPQSLFWGDSALSRPPGDLKLTLVSYEYKTFFQSSTVHFAWFLVNLVRALLCTSVNLGEIAHSLAAIPASFNLLLTVTWEILTFLMVSSSILSSAMLSFLFLKLIVGENTHRLHWWTSILPTFSRVWSKFPKSFCHSVNSLMVNTYDIAYIMHTSAMLLQSWWHYKLNPGKLAWSMFFNLNCIHLNYL